MNSLGPETGSQIGANDADAEHAVGPVEHLSHSRVSQRAHVDAGELWVALGKRGFAQDVGGHRQPQALRQADDQSGQAVAPRAHPDVERWPLGRGQHGSDLADGLVQGIGMSQAGRGCRLERERPGRWRNLGENPVARNLQVSRPLPADHVPQHAVDDLRSGCGVVEDRRVDGHFLEDSQLAFIRLDDVMQVDLVIPPAERHLGTAADDQKRGLLGVGARDRVERVERLPGRKKLSQNQSLSGCVVGSIRPPPAFLTSRTRRSTDGTDPTAGQAP